MIDINDYKLFYKRKLKKMSNIWLGLLFFISMGIILINKSFKYYEYYQNVGEYRDNHLNVYVLLDDLNKITRNREMLIEKEKFAYKVSSISEENVYLNGNYYKEVKLSVDIDKKNNDVAEIKIIDQEYSLLEYVFKTVWR